MGDCARMIKVIPLNNPYYMQLSCFTGVSVDDQDLFKNQNMEPVGVFVGSNIVCWCRRFELVTDSLEAA